MSRIGKKAVVVPAGVTANVNGQTVSVKGPKGELKAVLNEQVLVKMEQGGVKVDPINQTKLARSSWGMSRTLVANLVKGVTEGYSKSLEINGVGYRAALNGKQAVIVTVEYRGFTPSGELRHPVIRAWYRS